MTHVTLSLTVWEGSHLATLVGQFRDLIADETGGRRDDPAIARLVPDAYRDDRDAAAEFRRYTEADLLARRRADADVVAATLERADLAIDPGTLTDAAGLETRDITLDPDGAFAWLRTLAATRLVLATRLGIADEDTDLDDPRFGVYNWLGYRLETLLEAVDSAEPLRKSP